MGLLRAASEQPFPPGATIDITPKEVQVLSEDWAFEFGTASVSYTPEGREAKTIRDTYLLLIKKTENGWKAHREVASSHLPPCILSEN